MNATARLAFALTVSTALAGCGASPLDSPETLTPGCAAMADDGGTDRLVGWSESPGGEYDYEKSVLIDCGTKGVYLGDDGDHARFKPDGGAVLWVAKEWVKPLPAPSAAR